MIQHGGLELKMFGNKKYITATEKLENESRRNFLGTTAKGALALGLAGTGFLKSKDAHAYNIKDLPPGFWPEVCKDDRIRDVFSTMYFNFSNEYTPEEIKNILLARIGLASRQVSASSPLTEPAYWFTVEYYKYGYKPYGSVGIGDDGIRTMNRGIMTIFNKLNTNSPMFNWAEGINRYFRTWMIKNPTANAIETETYLLRSIFTASGRSESEVEDYKKYDLVQKERYLQSVMKDLEKQNYTNQLIATWSSFMYCNHESRKLNNTNVTPEGKLMNDLIEKPLRKYVPKIRGPPYYPGI